MKNTQKERRITVELTPIEASKVQAALLLVAKDYEIDLINNPSDYYALRIAEYLRALAKKFDFRR